MTWRSLVAIPGIVNAFSASRAYEAAKNPAPAPQRLQT
jgi:hypothetical protein